MIVIQKKEDNSIIRLISDELECKDTSSKGLANVCFKNLKISCLIIIGYVHFNSQNAVFTICSKSRAREYHKYQESVPLRWKLLCMSCH